jgi:hypothetical protein
MRRQNHAAKKAEGHAGITQALALRGRKVEELRRLASQHLKIDPATHSAVGLRQLLSVALETNRALARELANSPISLKPSFYLLAVQIDSDPNLLKREAERRARIFFNSVNDRLLKETETPVVKDFSMLSATKVDGHIVEIQLTWQHIIRYFSIEGRFEHVYALKPGFVFIDTDSSKALICCHSPSERDSIVDALEEQLPIKLSPMKLTRALLNEIGPFTKVQRARWSKADPGPDEAEEVSYSDLKLSTKKPAIHTENDPKRSRDHSFYRVNLSGAGETGVGVTSSTAKLWIPSETAVDNVRDFGLGLLRKFSTTIKGLKSDGDDNAVFELLGLENSSEFRTVTGHDLRKAIAELLRELFQMFLKGESERAYRPPDAFLTKAVPSWFNPARVRLEDEDNSSTMFWQAKNTGNQLVRFKLSFGKWSAFAYDGSQKLDLKSLSHPLTDNVVSVADPPLAVHLAPTPALHSLLMDGIKRLAPEYRRLDKCRALPFSIDSGRLTLDLAKARNEEFSESLHRQIESEAVKSFSTALGRHVSSAESTRLRKVLFSLKEKCAHMSPENCQNCLGHRKFLCLRSLVARFMSGSDLQIHSSIELSDLEGNLEVDGLPTRVWVFSKIGPRRSQLTLRNTNGAVLFSQIAYQIEKLGFGCVAVLTPSVVSQDLRNRLNFLANAAGKRFLILDGPLLEKLLAFFEEQTRIDGNDPLKVYRSSRSRTSKGRDMEAAGRFVSSSGGSASST